MNDSTKLNEVLDNNLKKQGDLTQEVLSLRQENSDL